ncbi:MAG: transglutaminase-like cysteine peptidase, partial [Proteobacteria bacterium]|nr:transglutaminase-like cysteine peptidase [Pseudomonadota bacterium]
DREITQDFNDAHSGTKVVPPARIYGHAMSAVTQQDLMDKTVEGAKKHPFLYTFNARWSALQDAQQWDDSNLNICFNDSSLLMCNRFGGMLQTVVENRDRPLPEKMAAAQRFFNQYITYTKDESTFKRTIEGDKDTTFEDLRQMMADKIGMPLSQGADKNKERSTVKGDVWQTSWETLVRKFGDCEDYMEAKRQMLIAMGVPADRMYAVIGYSKIGDSQLPKNPDGSIDHEKMQQDERYKVGDRYYGGHATLVVVDEDGRVYDLENYSANHAWGKIDPADEKSEKFVPMYAFGEGGIYAFEGGDSDLFSSIKDQITERATAGMEKPARAVTSPQDNP